MKRFRGWKGLTGIFIFVFVLSVFLLPGFVTTSIAEQRAATTAGAKAGAATTAGLSKGTIVALVVAAAAIAGIIAASGDDDDVVAISGKSDAQETAEDFLAAADATTEKAMTDTTQALTGTGDLQNLNGFFESLDASVLGDWQAGFLEGLTLDDVGAALDALTADGLLKAALQKQAMTNFPTEAAYALYSALYDGLNNPKYTKGARALANLLASLRKNGNIKGLTGLGNLIRSILEGELAATKNQIAGIGSDPDNYINALLTAIHTGYNVTVLSTYHGGGITTTTVHLAKNQ
jgi:hypothetical protein